MKQSEIKRRADVVVSAIMNDWSRDQLLELGRAADPTIVKGPANNISNTGLRKIILGKLQELHQPTIETGFSIMHQRARAAAKALGLNPALFD